MNAPASLEGPMRTNCSNSQNVHRLKRPASNVLLLTPGPSLWIGAIVCLLIVPFVVWICTFKKADPTITTLASLVPVFGAGVAILWWRLSTRVVFDRNRQNFAITGARHGNWACRPLSEIEAVQFCDAGIKGEDGSWHAYQVNLVLRDSTDEISRVNLLDCGGETELLKIAQDIAEFCTVPLHKIPKVS